MQKCAKACENPSINIANSLSRERELHIKHTKEAAPCNLSSGTPGISLTGHKDDANASPGGNRANFMELVKFRAKTDEALAAHLRKAPLNATCTCKTSENQRLSTIVE